MAKAKVAMTSIEALQGCLQNKCQYAETLECNSTHLPMEVQGIGGHEERDRIILDNQVYKFCLLPGMEEVFYATGIKKKPTCQCPSARVKMPTGFLGFGVPRVGV